jgi:hypothetical protein
MYEYKVIYICVYKVRWTFLKLGRQIKFVQRYKEKDFKYASIITSLRQFPLYK